MPPALVSVVATTLAVGGAQLDDDAGQRRARRVLHAVAVAVVPHKVAQLEQVEEAKVEREVARAERAGAHRDADTLAAAERHGVRVERVVDAGRVGARRVEAEQRRLRAVDHHHVVGVGAHAVRVRREQVEAVAVGRVVATSMPAGVSRRTVTLARGASLASWSPALSLSIQT
jgi:hypothetical protein